MIRISSEKMSLRYRFIELHDACNERIQPMSNLINTFHCEKFRLHDAIVLLHQSDSPCEGKYMDIKVRKQFILEEISLKAVNIQNSVICSSLHLHQLQPKI